MDITARASVAFLLSSAFLTFISLPIDGYLRADRLLLYVAVGTGCLLLGLYTAWVGRLSGARAAAVIFIGDVGIVVASTCFTDPGAGRVIAVMLTLPTLFISLFMSMRWLVVQGFVTAVAAWFIVEPASQSLAVALLHSAVVLVSAACPAVIVLVLRSQLARAVDRAEVLATTDPLTGLINRRGLEERLPGLLARASRAGLPVGVLAADLDHFKRVNDVHGHAVGDEVLRVAAAAVAGCVRGDDLVVRLGGEELAVVTALPADDLARLAERIRLRVADAAAGWGVTVSLGVASAPPGAAGADPQALLAVLLDRSDAALYEAKHGGRNQVRFSGQFVHDGTVPHHAGGAAAG